jgi:hypothetical protein
MPVLRIPLPTQLERTIHPTQLQDGLSPVIQRTMLFFQDGRAIRGKGQARANADYGFSSIVGACFFQRRDCKRILVASTRGGTWFAQTGLGLPNCACAGPLPLYTDIDIAEEDQGRFTQTVLDAAGSTPSVAMANAKAGRVYRFVAMGQWAWGTGLAGQTSGPEGTAVINGSGDYAGFRRGALIIKEPGSAVWVAYGTGGYKDISPTVDGNIQVIFSDEINWADNIGAMNIVVETL